MRTKWGDINPEEVYEFVEKEIVHEMWEAQIG